MVIQNYNQAKLQSKYYLNTQILSVNLLYINFLLVDFKNRIADILGNVHNIVV